MHLLSRGRQKNSLIWFATAALRSASLNDEEKAVMIQFLKSLGLASFLAAFMAASLTVPAPSVRAEDRVYIKVGEARVKKSLIAVPPFQFLGTPSLAPRFREIGTELYNTVVNDLDVSSLFTFIKQEAFVENTAKTSLRPGGPGNPNGFKFESWNSIGAEFLIRGGYTLEGDNLEFEVYLYYVPQASLVIGKKYLGRSTDARRVAHTFADDLMKALTGKKGVFKTKFVVASDRAGHKWKEVFVVDWDGRNPVQITNHHTVSLSPNWAPSGKTVSYTSFAYHVNQKTRNPDLFTYDLYSGKRFLISSRKGMNSGSAFTPDGKSIYLTISAGTGNADIYRMSLDGESLTRITNTHGAMNVEPNVSPDGKKVAFSSDRSGQPMIYTMDPDGSGSKRLTFAGKYNSSPAWSPDGKKIAFAGYDKSHFDIFIMNTDGTSLERLTSAKKPNGEMADNEDPSFSPDGRFIVFTSNRTGKNQIYMINADGTGERRITVDNANYFKARWSPYLD